MLDDSVKGSRRIARIIGKFPRFLLEIVEIILGKEVWDSRMTIDSYSVFTSAIYDIRIFNEDVMFKFGFFQNHNSSFRSR